MTDAERISTLLRQGFSADAIAALLDTDLENVRDVQLGDDSLPAGGGGVGLIVGDWEDLDATDLYGGNADPWPVEPVLEVPCELEVVVAPNANTSGGVIIVDHDTAQVYVSQFGQWGDDTPSFYVKTILPAGAAVDILPGFGDTANYSISGLRRRPLG